MYYEVTHILSNIVAKNVSNGSNDFNTELHWMNILSLVKVYIVLMKRFMFTGDEKILQCSVKVNYFTVFMIGLYVMYMLHGAQSHHNKLLIF